MVLRLLCLLMFGHWLLAQNNLIIFNSSGKNFKLTILPEYSQREVALEHIIRGIKLDTVQVEIICGDLKLSRTLYLLAKGKKTQHHDFIYILETDSSKNRMNLRFGGMKETVPLPNPLVPEKPKVDTQFVFKNKPYGSIFEIKNGKAFFYENTKQGEMCTEPTKESDLNYIFKLIEKSNVRTEKTRYVFETVANNCLSCAQLSSLMKTMEFELDRIKVVKLSYHHITDPQNRNELLEAVNYSSSKKELKEVLDNKSNLKKTNCVEAVPDTIIKTIVKKLKVMESDSEKLNYLKNLPGNSCYLSAHVRQLAIEFIHDDEKLKLCTFFYPKVKDPQQLDKLSDIFTFKENSDQYKIFLIKAAQ